VGSTPGLNKLRKLELERKKLIDCGRCPYHKGDNARSGHDRTRDDRYKDHRPRIGKEERSWEMFGVE
jgi:hypothetical protein